MHDDVNKWRRLWIAGSLLASGCAFTVDASVIKQGDGGEIPAMEAGSGDTDAGVLEPDADVTDADEPDADVTDADEPDAADDSGSVEPPPLCGQSECPQACSEDAECAVNEYCSKTRRTCASRCDEQVGCAGPHVETRLLWTYPFAILSDDQAVYWTTDTRDDLTGNPLNDGAVWSWNLVDDPVEVLSGLHSPKLLFIADGQIYYNEAKQFPGDLYRTNLDGSGSPELLGEHALRAWTSKQFVYWSIGAGSSVELWRLRRASPLAPERLMVAAHDGWVCGNEELVFHGERRGASPFDAYLVADSLADPAVHRDVSGPFNGGDFTQNTCIANGDVLYLSDPHAGEHTRRLDLTGHDDDKSLTPLLSGSAYFFAQDGWVYWSFANSQIAVYGRTQGDFLAPTVELLQTGDGSPGFAVHDDKIVYMNFLEKRLFTRELSPLPCRADLPCPSGQSCTSAMLCE